MARIPLQIAERTLDTGNVVQYPQGGGPVGAAVEGFGGVLQNIASRHAETQQREELFDAKIVEQEWGNEQDRLDLQAIENAAADGTGLHDGVYGEMDPQTGQVVKPGLFDKLFDQFTQRMPASQRQRWVQQKEAMRGQRSVRMAGIQLEQRRRYETVEIEKQKTAFLNRVMELDPDDTAGYDAILNEFETLVVTSKKDALAKEVDIIKMKEDAAVALGEAVRERDPERLKTMIGMPTQPTTQPGFGGAAVTPDELDGVVDRIIHVESGGKANAKNPLSSATGPGQFIDSTWMRVISSYRPDIARGKSRAEILALRRDPQLSREMTKALTLESVEYLGNQGVPATAGNLYLAHFAGAGGAVRILKADPNASVASVLGGAKVRANPFTRNMTAAGLTAWANRKMGGPAPARGNFVQGEIDPRFAALSYEQRQALANRADATIREQMALMRGQLETVIDNAPAAIQNTGRYDGMLPSEDDFVRAYGADDGSQRYRAFDTAVQTAGEVHSMKTMPSSEIQALVQEAVPTASGDSAVIEGQRYEVLASAAQATMKARTDDPSAYVMNAFPHVRELGDAAVARGAPPEAMQAFITASIAAQRQIGIPELDIRPASDAIAEGAVAGWKNEGAAPDVRINAVASVLQSTSDPAQRKALFEQFVEAGLPDLTEGAFAALMRGDRNSAAAGRRLLTAALTNVADLPGKLPDTPQKIEEEIQAQIMDDGMIGERFYGLSTGAAQAAGRAERDSKLLVNAVTLRLRAGEKLKDAVAGAAADLYGEVQMLDGNSRINVSALIPLEADPEKYLAGLEAEMPKVDADMRQFLKVPEEANVASGMRAVFDFSTAYYVEREIDKGEWRQVDDNGGFVYLTSTGLPISDDKGPIIYRPNLGLPTTETEIEAARPPRVGTPQQAIEREQQENIERVLGTTPPGMPPQTPPPPEPTPATLGVPTPTVSQSTPKGDRLRPSGKGDRLTPSGSIPLPGSARWGQ